MSGKGERSSLRTVSSEDQLVGHRPLPPAGVGTSMAYFAYCASIPYAISDPDELVGHDERVEIYKYKYINNNNNKYSIFLRMR
jgi:hypothetical protein